MTHSIYGKRLFNESDTPWREAPNLQQELYPEVAGHFYEDRYEFDVASYTDTTDSETTANIRWVDMNMNLSMDTGDLVNGQTIKTETPDPSLIPESQRLETERLSRQLLQNLLGINNYYDDPQAKLEQYKSLKYIFPDPDAQPSTEKSISIRKQHLYHKGPFFIAYDESLPYDKSNDDYFKHVAVYDGSVGECFDCQETRSYEYRVEWGAHRTNHELENWVCSTKSLWQDCAMVLTWGMVSEQQFSAYFYSGAPELEQFNHLLEMHRLAQQRRVAEENPPQGVVEK